MSLHDVQSHLSSSASASVAPRRWKRYPVSLSLRVKVPPSAGGVYMLAHGRDASQGGMAVYVPAEIEINDIVVLELFSDSEQPLFINGVVKNREGFKYGIEFINPTPEQQGRLLIHLYRLLAASDR